MGAYFPGPLWNAEGENRELEPSTPHFLFQLRPKIQLHRWDGPYIPLTKLISIENDVSLLGAVAASNESFL